MPPLAGSPAIDAGGTSAFTTDQRGFPRPSGATPDIGAVEIQQVFVTTDRTRDGDIDPALGAGTSLREAIVTTRHPTSTLHHLHPGLDGATIVLASSRLVVGNNLTVDALRSRTGSPSTATKPTGAST